MIDEKLKRKIMPNLKLELPKQDWRFIEDMFSEVYLTNENGHNVVSLKPPSNYVPLEGQMRLTMQFYVINGAYFGIDDWEYIKMRGTKL